MEDTVITEDTNIEEIPSKIISTASSVRNDKKWMDDDSVPNCMNCNSSFSTFLRQHHCRCCGKIFCSKCITTSYIPNYVEKLEEKDNKNLSYWITFLKPTHPYVCMKCDKIIKEKTKIVENIKKIKANPISIDTLQKNYGDSTETVSDYFEQMQKIQKTVGYSDEVYFHKGMLECNYTKFPKHSKYITQLIKLINWKSESEYSKWEPRLLQIFANKKNIECEELCCIKGCSETLTFENCIDILTCDSISYFPNFLLEHIFNIIKNGDIETICCYIPFFVKLIYKITKGKLDEQLISLFKINEVVLINAYWFIEYESDCADGIGIKKISQFWKKYQMLSDNDDITKIENERKFFSEIIKNLDNIEKIQNHLTLRLSQSSIRLPYNPNIKIVNFVGKIVQMKSANKPIVIKFGTSDGNTISLMFKRASVLNDCICMNLSKFWLKLLSPKLNHVNSIQPVIYPVLPLGKEEGMCEFVPNSKTLNSLKSEQISIYQHVFSKCPKDASVKDIKYIYMNGLVFYTLFSYFLCPGDRHSGNIMITDSGTIFHIDFDFIIGQNVHLRKIFDPNIRLTHQMLEVIKPDLYDEYINLVTEGVLLLINYYSTLYALLNILPHQKIKKYVEEVCGVLQQEETIRATIKPKIERASNTNEILTNTLYDQLSGDKVVTVAKSVTTSITSSVTNFVTSLFKQK